MDSCRCCIQQCQPEKEEGKKQGMEGKQSVFWSSHFHADKTISSRMSVVPGLTQPHPGCTADIVRSVLWLCGCRPLLYQVIEEFPSLGRRNLAWGAAKAGGKGIIRSDPAFWQLFLPSLHLHRTRRMGWLFNKSKPVSFFKIEISQVISLPCGPLPLSGWKNNWSHMSLFD